jgi:hypothetical protein
LKRRLLTAAIAAATFALPLIWSLSTQILFRVEEPLAVEASQPLFALQIPELTYLRTADGQSTYRLRLSAPQLTKLLERSEIGLRVADYEETRTILSAAIISPAANCGYAARGGETLPNNDVLVFVRRQKCAPLSDNAQNELVLTIQLNAPGPVGVWTAGRSVTPGTDIEILVADRVAGRYAGRAVVGSLGHTDALRSRSRLALLNYVWQVSQSPWWLIALIIGAVVLAGIAGFLLSDARVLAGDRGPSVEWHSVIGAFCAALALAIVYTSLIPPLQAADEPNHFVGLAYFLGEAELVRETTALAQIEQYDRIVFRPDQHFNPSNIGHPDAIWWGIAGDPPWDLRGTGVFDVWYIFAPLVRGHSAATTLLLTRVLNAIVFACAVGLFVSLIAVFSPSRFPILNAFPLFIIPTLPYFGMQVSNYAPLCAAYVIFAGALMVFVWDGRRSYLSGPIMGSMWAAATLLSRSAIPLAPLLVGCAAARAVLGPRRTSVPAAVVFWVGLTLPCAIALSLIPQQLSDLARRTASSGLPAGLRAIWVFVDHPWALVVVGAAASAAELWLHRNKRQEEHADHRVAAEVTRVLACAAAVLLGVSMVASAFVRYPSAPVVDPHHAPPTGWYLFRMLLAGMTMFRLSQPDFLTSLSFWSGFGWLDTPMPDWTVIALAASTGAALLVLFVWIAKSGAYRTGVSLFLILAGLVGAFLMSAFFVVRSTFGDLHGRYLLGIYLCLIALSWHCLPRLIENARSQWRNAVLAVCGVAVITIHGIAFATILRRYFG